MLQFLLGDFIGLTTCVLNSMQSIVYRWCRSKVQDRHMVWSTETALISGGSNQGARDHGQIIDSKGGSTSVHIYEMLLNEFLSKLSCAAGTRWMPQHCHF
jgi:hypothetical protein